MNTHKRREQIVELLSSSHEPISGKELAKVFGVTRQVIVQDIAILRASGKDIIATAQGVLDERSPAHLHQANRRMS